MKKLTITKPDGQFNSYDVADITLDFLITQPFPGAIRFFDVKRVEYIFRWEEIFMLKLERCE